MMREAQHWLDEYTRDHQNPVNKTMHRICVPLIVVSLIGLLWSLPTPEAFPRISVALNWGTAFLLAAVVYYFVMSIPLALGMLPFVLLVVVIVNWMDGLPGPLWLWSGTVFVVAWIGQFYGHAVEGRRPAFFRDLQFLMIGPLWLLAALYRRFGIPY